MSLCLLICSFSKTNTFILSLNNHDDWTDLNYIFNQFFWWRRWWKLERIIHINFYFLKTKNNSKVLSTIKGFFPENPIFQDVGEKILHRIVFLHVLFFHLFFTIFFKYPFTFDACRKGGPSTEKSPPPPKKKKTFLSEWKVLGEGVSDRNIKVFLIFFCFLLDFSVFPICCYIVRSKHPLVQTFHWLGNGFFGGDYFRTTFLASVIYERIFKKKNEKKKTCKKTLLCKNLLNVLKNRVFGKKIP